MPAMRPVFSSHVHSIGYDEETRELHVRFQAIGNTPSRTAVYRDVSPKIANGVLTAPSIGMALHLRVRGQHDFGYLKEGE